MKLALAGWMMVWAGMAVASSAPETSLRPISRDAPVAVVSSQSYARVRPVARADELTRRLAEAVKSVTQPEVDPIVAQAQLVLAASAGTAGGLTRSLRPLARPGALVEQVMAKRKARRAGSVCGDLDLQGEVVGFVPGKISGCGIPDAIRLTSVSGVALSQSSLMRCTTAKALKRWVDKSAKPDIGNRGGGLKELRVAAHYSCRTRNNQPGAKISEHGKGNAIDISAFRLENGSEISVLTDWGKGRDGRILKKMHAGACGPFGTVLGPEADRHHKDHFHFDVAKHGNGAYCR